jgi:DNA-binding phage protein
MKLNATIVSCNYNCKYSRCQLELHKMQPSHVRVHRAAEDRLRTTIAKEFRRAVSAYKSEQAAARDLGISRQRLKKYLDRKMTPKADVLLAAMVTWNLKIVHEGVIFSARLSQSKPKAAPPEQLSLEYFDEPQVLRDGKRNVEVKVSRKRTDMLEFAVKVRLAG